MARGSKGDEEKRHKVPGVVVTVHLDGIVSGEERGQKENARTEERHPRRWQPAERMPGRGDDMTVDPMVWDARGFMSWGQGVRSGRHARDHGRLGTMQPARLCWTGWSLGDGAAHLAAICLMGWGVDGKPTRRSPAGGAESGRPVAGSPTQPLLVPNQAVLTRHVVIRRG